MYTKKCKLCKRVKNLSEFYYTKGYYQSRCKPCFNEYQKNNPNRKANNLRYYYNHKEVANND